MADDPVPITATVLPSQSAAYACQLNQFLSWIAVSENCSLESQFAVCSNVPLKSCRPGILGPRADKQFFFSDHHFKNLTYTSNC